MIQTSSLQTGEISASGLTDHPLHAVQEAELLRYLGTAESNNGKATNKT